MSGSLTVTQAIRGLLDAFGGATEQGVQEALLVSEGGQDWTADWVRGNTANGEARPDLLARDDGQVKFGLLCKQVRKIGGAYLRAAAELEAEVTGTDAVLSANTLQSFEKILARGGTPWCS